MTKKKILENQTHQQPERNYLENSAIRISIYSQHRASATKVSGKFEDTKSVIVKPGAQATKVFNGTNNITVTPSASATKKKYFRKFKNTKRIFVKPGESKKMAKNTKTADRLSDYEIHGNGNNIYQEDEPNE